MKQIEEINKEFTELLWKMPHHWFSEFNNGIRVMDPINYALYQSFCLHYGYEHGKFDLVSEEERKVTYTDPNGKKITYSPIWGQCEGDYKIIRPIFEREKLKYKEEMKIKQTLLARINKIKIEEKGFSSKEWDNVNFAKTGPDEKAKHVSDISPENLSEEDFVRYFEYIIRMQVDIVSARVKATYFS